MSDSRSGAEHVQDGPRISVVLECKEITNITEVVQKNSGVNLNGLSGTGGKIMASKTVIPTID